MLDQEEVVFKLSEECRAAISDRLRNCMRAEHEGATLSPAAAQAATVLVCALRLLLSWNSYDRHSRVRRIHVIPATTAQDVSFLVVVKCCCYARFYTSLLQPIGCDRR
jgi:hypothetical protein